MNYLHQELWQLYKKINAPKSKNNTTDTGCSIIQQRKQRKDKPIQTIKSFKNTEPDRKSTQKGNVGTASCEIGNHRINV